jgi:hypothetical protein
MGRGEKIESAAVEEDSGAVVEGVTETTGIGLEGLDFGVEALGHGIGDGEKREVEQPLQMLGQHLSLSESLCLGQKLKGQEND